MLKKSSASDVLGSKGADKVNGASAEPLTDLNFTFPSYAGQSPKAPERERTGRVYLWKLCTLDFVASLPTSAHLARIEKSGAIQLKLNEILSGRREETNCG